MFEVAILLIFFLIVLPVHIHAYLDPGTGSYLTQILIGFLLGGVYIVKKYFHQIISFVKKFLHKSEGHDQESKH